MSHILSFKTNAQPYADSLQHSLPLSVMQPAVLRAVPQWDTGAATHDKSNDHCFIYFSLSLV